MLYCLKIPLTDIRCYGLVNSDLLTLYNHTESLIPFDEVYIPRQIYINQHPICNDAPILSWNNYIKSMLQTPQQYHTSRTNQRIFIK